MDGQEKRERMDKPLLAISAGDPAGIGPEICIRALCNEEINAYCRPLVVCTASVIKQALQICRCPLEIHEISNPGQGIYRTGMLNVLDTGHIHMESFKYGQVDAMTGKASFDYVKKAIELAMDHKVDATVTGPIHKEAIHKAGYHFAGHTEIYAHFTQTKNYAMMLADKDFRVVHVSTHLSLLDAIKRVTADRVLNTIQLADVALKKMGISVPRIAVSGLNPHAGENGLFGNEESEHIMPAIESARSMGIRADGPHPPDTIFPRMRGGEYDVVVCMYHDQGHIPTKLLGFSYNHQKKMWEGISGVNITLGLPVIRVSVDHGTAFDKAGRCEANPESMMQAIYYASKLARR